MSKRNLISKKENEEKGRNIFRLQAYQLWRRIRDGWNEEKKKLSSKLSSREMCEEEKYENRLDSALNDTIEKAGLWESKWKREMKRRRREAIEMKLWKRREEREKREREKKAIEAGSDLLYGLERK